MAFCINCGQELAEGAKFCANCGKAVTGESTISQRKTREISTNVQIAVKFSILL